MTISDHSDIWLCVSMVGLGGFAIWRIQSQLQQFRDAVEIKKPEKTPGQVDKETEDAIKLETLVELTNSPNPDLCEASCNILKDRLLNSNTAWKLLLRNLASSNSGQRHQALKVLFFVMPEEPWRSGDTAKWWQPEFASAVVACLRNLLPSLHQAYARDEFPSEAQMTALQVTHVLISNSRRWNIRRFLDAGLVCDWLAHYPFQDEPQNEKSLVVSRILNGERGKPCHTPELKDIISNLSNLSRTDEVTAASLVEAGLCRSEPMLLERNERARNVDEDAEAVQRRRTHREAAVIIEEGRPIEASDIIQRVNDI